MEKGEKDRGGGGLVFEWGTRTEKLRLAEDSFANGVIKGSERVTTWLRVVSRTDLNSDQSQLVRGPPSLSLLVVRC